MDNTQILKSTQEQAVASWINQLNQIRLDDLVEKLTAQDCNLENALDELQKFKDFIGTPEHILGNPTTKAGEIAEHAQVNFNNARRLVQGLKTRLSFDGVGRTAPEDFLYRGAPIQSKAYGPTWNKGSGSIITNGGTEHNQGDPRAYAKISGFFAAWRRQQRARLLCYSERLL